jgi:pSer/pThr/pTyr-binding forkhead associated (FHA) protein
MVVVVVVESSPSQLPLELSFEADQLVSVGRDPGCDVQLPDASVSQRHALIRPSQSGPMLVDQGSTNGSWLNSVRLVAGGGKLLSDGDEVRLGRAQLQIRLRTAGTAPRVELSTQDIALAMVQGALIESGSTVAPRLRVVEGPDRGVELLLSEERSYVIGRDEGADLRLSDDDASRSHARVVRRGSRLWVLDVGSRNGSRLDDRPLEPHLAVLWPDTSALQIGSSQLCIDDPVSSALRRLESVPDEHIARREAAPEPAPPPTATQVMLGQPASRTPEDNRGLRDISAPFSSVTDQKSLLKLSTSSSSSAPSAPIAVLVAGESEPPDGLERRARKWSTLDALVVGVAVLTIAVSALALAWFLVS